MGKARSQNKGVEVQRALPKLAFAARCRVFSTSCGLGSCGGYSSSSSALDWDRSSWTGDDSRCTEGPQPQHWSFAVRSSGASLAVSASSRCKGTALAACSSERFSDAEAKQRHAQAQQHAWLAGDVNGSSSALPPTNSAKCWQPWQSVREASRFYRL